MQTYWNERFSSGGKIWGNKPSNTAEYARVLFHKDNVRSILIPGSGYGRNALAFASAGFSVTGIEISDEALKLAGSNDPSIIYYKGSVLDMPYGNEILSMRNECSYGSI